ncbi:MAG: RNA methyltransferase [Chitinophagaceae bacterium]
MGHKKLRESERVFVAEGPKLINELLGSGNVKPVAIYAVDAFADKHPQLQQLVGISNAELERISALSTPNEALGIFNQPVFEEPSFANGITLMLDGIQDPGNLGSIIRSADWFGVRTIICSNDCADNFNSKVVQSTMGSIARVQLVYTDLHEFIDSSFLPSLYAATLNGQNVFEMEPVKEGVLIIGNESKGIHEELIKKAHHHITIPRKGKAESLNAGVAAGVLLSHLI